MRPPTKQGPVTDGFANVMRYKASDRSADIFSTRKRITSGSSAVARPALRNLVCVFALLLNFCAACSVEPNQTDPIREAFERHKSDVQVEGEGVVTQILSDDMTGRPHQRFILRMKSGQTVLIEHNIVVARRVDDIKIGDAVGFSGEYVWNEQGGLIHWTHHDPAGRHEAGWIKVDGRVYQ